jgi:signal transduction histidine kinase
VKSATRRKGKAPESFEGQYRSSLREYAEGGGELALGRAYDLGRRALTEKKILVEMASLHHRAVLDLVRSVEDQKHREEFLHTSFEFFAECVSPYEMARRGFQDAVTALRQLNETLEEEIKRIAYAVHDEAGQLLVAVHLALADVASELPERQQAKFARITELLNEVEKHLRRYSHELRPTILDDLGWISAIRFLADGISKRANLPIHIEATIPERLPSTIETTLYRIVQESLTKAVKHARAGNAWIRARRDNAILCCSIRGRRRGIRYSSGPKRTATQRTWADRNARASECHRGTLQIDSRPGYGTELSIRIPLEGKHANSNRTRG